MVFSFCLHVSFIVVSVLNIYFFRPQSRKHFTKVQLACFFALPFCCRFLKLTTCGSGDIFVVWRKTYLQLILDKTPNLVICKTFARNIVFFCICNYLQIEWIRFFCVRSCLILLPSVAFNKPKVLLLTGCHRLFARDCLREVSKHFTRSTEKSVGKNWRNPLWNQNCKIWKFCGKVIAIVLTWCVQRYRIF